MKLPQPHFSIRGYYTIPSRNQLWGLEEWKQFVDCMIQDNCNFLIWWIEGGFPSRRFPDTWSYNRQHPNMSTDFYRDLIDYAKSNGIQTVLGFSPYAYDGLGSYMTAHPELAGLNDTGEVRRNPGIHDVSMVMCPQKRAAREFMLDYIREMYFDFYPNADGLFVESSDYGHCMCPECQQSYTQREWEFVHAVSSDVWSANPDARVVIYPLYYQKNVAQPDPKFTLFFTPHSAHMTPDVMAIDCDKIYWTMLFGEPLESVKTAARLAADNGIQGYVPAMETFGISREIGGRNYDLTPFDVPWAKPGTLPFDDLIVKALRFTVKCYANSPYMTDDEYVAAVADEFMPIDGPGFQIPDHQSAHDLIYLVSELQKDWRAFWFRSPLVHPDEFERHYPEDKRAAAREWIDSTLTRFRAIRDRHASSDSTAGEMARIAGWIVDRWESVS
jgi:hypothetical protein